jgi:hypothetical protein
MSETVLHLDGDVFIDPIEGTPDLRGAVEPPFAGLRPMVPRDRRISGVPGGLARLRAVPEGIGRVTGEPAP